MERNTSALRAYTAASDQSTKDGYFVDNDGVIVTSAWAVPAGVIIDGGESGGTSSYATPKHQGAVTVKVGATTGAIVKGSRLQLNSDGTVRLDIGTGRVVAIAEETGTATELISARLVEPEPSGDRYGAIVTADATLTAAQLRAGVVVSNKGATGAVVVTLPAALPGMRLTAIVETAQELRLNPQDDETIALPSTAVQGAAGKYITADAATEHVNLVCVTAGDWSVAGYSGTWTAEA